MASPCLCKPPMALGVASHVKPVTKQTFGRTSPGAARGAAPEALPNRALASTSLATSAVNDLAVLSQQKQRQALCLKLVLGLDGLAYFSQL